MGVRKDGSHSVGNPQLKFRVSKDTKRKTERVAQSKGLTTSGYLTKILMKDLKANGETIEE